MSSKTGDLLLELEASDENIRDAWVSRSVHLLRLNLIQNSVPKNGSP